MFRRKGRATALKKCTVAVSLKRPLAPQGVLHSLDQHETVKSRFAGQEPSFTPMFVVRHMTEQPHSTSAADQSSYPCIRKCLVVMDRCRVLRQMLAEVAVRHKKSRGDSTQWHKPLGIRKPELGGARPDFFLIGEKIGS